jgi:signal peptidase
MSSSAVLTLVARSPRFAHLRAAFERTNKAAAIALTVVVCLFWAQYLRPQAFGGSAAYVLVSGKSMLPRYHTGDLVLVEKQASYHVGELIAYRVPKGDAMAGAQVIHRIIGGNAKQGFVVQGDNRTAPDVWRPKPSDIVGAKALRIPNAVLILQFFRSPIFLGLLAACFVFVRVLIPSGDEAEVVEQDGDDKDDALRRAA